MVDQRLYMILPISSKTVIYTALFQYGIGGVTRLDFAVNRDVAFCDGAMPNIVISLASPDKTASVLSKDIAHLFFVFRH
jgi:hypothetical protein